VKAVHRNYSRKERRLWKKRPGVRKRRKKKKKKRGGGAPCSACGLYAPRDSVASRGPVSATEEEEKGCKEADLTFLMADKGPPKDAPQSGGRKRGEGGDEKGKKFFTHQARTTLR